MVLTSSMFCISFCQQLPTLGLAEKSKMKTQKKMEYIKAMTNVRFDRFVTPQLYSKLL